MAARGKRAAPEQERQLRSLVQARRMRPERYLETFFQETARRINFILLRSSQSFEAAKFRLELQALLSRCPSGPLRRA